MAPAGTSCIGSSIAPTVFIRIACFLQTLTVDYHGYSFALTVTNTPSIRRGPESWGTEYT